MRQPNAIMMGRQEIPSNSTPFWCVATRCRVITYVMAAVLPLLLLIVVARFDPELNRSESTDWNSLISRADEALSRGDRYEARRLYVQVDRVAYWRNDWQGLVAAACRINKLDGANRPYSKSLAILFRGVDDCRTRPKSSRTCHRGEVSLTARFGRSRFCDPRQDSTELAL